MSAPNLMYGIEYENYDVITEKVGSGQTLSHILDGLGVGPATVDRIDRESRSVFDMRGMRAGQPYTAFMEHDSLGRSCATSFTRKIPRITSWYRSQVTP